MGTISDTLSVTPVSGRASRLADTQWENLTKFNAGQHYISSDLTILRSKYNLIDRIIVAWNKSHYDKVQVAANIKSLLEKKCPLNGSNLRSVSDTDINSLRKIYLKLDRGSIGFRFGNNERTPLAGIDGNQTIQECKKIAGDALGIGIRRNLPPAGKADSASPTPSNGRASTASDRTSISGISTATTPISTGLASPFTSDRAPSTPPAVAASTTPISTKAMSPKQKKSSDSSDPIVSAFSQIRESLIGKPKIIQEAVIKHIYQALSKLKDSYDDATHTPAVEVAANILRTALTKTESGEYASISRDSFSRHIPVSMRTQVEMALEKIVGTIPEIITSLETLCKCKNKLSDVERISEKTSLNIQSTRTALEEVLKDQKKLTDSLSSYENSQLQPMLLELEILVTKKIESELAYEQAAKDYFEAKNERERLENLKSSGHYQKVDIDAALLKANTKLETAHLIMKETGAAIAECEEEIPKFELAIDCLTKKINELNISITANKNLIAEITSNLEKLNSLNTRISSAIATLEEQRAKAINDLSRAGFPITAKR